MTTTEKVAYLKGLAEGMELNNDTKEGKILSAIIDVLNDMALDMEDLGEELTELGEQVDEIDEDLADVEDLLYEDEDEDEDFDFEDDDLFAVACPHCDAEFEVSEEELLADEGIECPMCGELLTFDIEECDGDCSCCEEDCDNKE